MALVPHAVAWPIISKFVFVVVPHVPDVASSHLVKSEVIYIGTCHF